MPEERGERVEEKLIDNSFIRCAPIRSLDDIVVYCPCDKSDARTNLRICQARQVRRRCDRNRAAKKCQYLGFLEGCGCSHEELVFVGRKNLYKIKCSKCGLEMSALFLSGRFPDVGEKVVLDKEKREIRVAK